MAKQFYPYQKIDSDYFNKANFSVTVSHDIRCTKSDLVASLAGDASWLEWATGLKAVTWHNKTADMVGSTRRVDMVGGDSVEETFFKWDPEGHISFYVTEGTLKPVSIFAERYLFTQKDNDTITLEWTVVIESTGVTGACMKLFKPVMGMLFKSWLKNLQKQLEK